MASITDKKSKKKKRGGLLKIIQFKCPTSGKRYSIRCGKLTMKQAEKIKTKVEELVICKETASPWSMELTSWINAIGVDFYRVPVKIQYRLICRA